MPIEEVTIAEALKPLGYATALFGKWHHGKPRDGKKEYVHPMDPGFDAIVFTSDHGATFESGNQGTSAALDSNRPFRGQKRTLWEGGVRVPAFACWPGRILPGVSTREVMHLTDLLPTFVAAAGGKVAPAWHVDGANLLAAWTGRATAPTRTLFWEWRSEGSNQLAALRGQLKLAITCGGKPELFDVEGDPAERRDISAQYAELTRQLRAELAAWLKTETRR